MTKNRLEAFSDGVIAILITIMVLGLTIPRGDQLGDLWHVRYVFIGYVLSFLYLAIYWNNHHHMLYVTGRVTGGVLWANMHLLFWLSLVPFVTGWMGENSLAHAPTAMYGVVLLMAAIAYFVLQRVIILSQGERSDPLRHRHPDGVRAAVGRLQHLRAGRAHVDHPRHAHRAGRGGA